MAEPSALRMATDDPAGAAGDPLARALLDAILARPEDDALRAVYADRLEELGDDVRAEHVRAQLIAAGATGAVGASAAGADDRAVARARAEQLEATHGRQLAGVVARYAERWTFSRGLVSSITADLIALGDHLAALLAAAPIQAIQVRHCGDEVDDEPRRQAATAVAACARLATVHTIDATFGSFEDEPLRLVLGSPHLTGLHRLVLGRDTSAASIALIAAAHARLPALRALCCYPEMANVGDAGAAALAESPLLARLDTLELWGSNVGPEGAIALFGAPDLGGLRHLALSATAYEANLIGPRGAVALASAGLAAIETLELRGAGIEDAGLEALAGAAWLAHVSNLALDANQLTDRGVLELARSPYATGLERLWLDDNAVSDAALAALEQLPGLRRLRFGDRWRVVR